MMIMIMKTPGSLFRNINMEPHERETCAGRSSRKTCAGRSSKHNVFDDRNAMSMHM